MIIELLLDVIYSIFNILTTPINIPDLPAEVHQYLETAFDYMAAGGGIIANYAPLTYIIVLFSVILLVDVGINLYHFVMWIIKKIPMLGIS